MDWSKKADELKASYGEAIKKHHTPAIEHVQKKYRIKGSLSLESDALSRGGLSDGEMIEICLSCGFDSTDFSGLLDQMTADYYAKIAELCS